MNNTRKNSATIKSVAKKAGVSVSTASRALNGNGYSSVETQQRVRRAATELSYSPHAAARSLKLKRTDTVGLMISDIVNPFYAHLADGVLDCARQLGYHVILCATDEDQELEKEYLDVLMQERVDGIIAVPTGHNLSLWRQAIDLGTRLVLVDREITGIPTDVVLIDNVKGARDATTYLIGLGHKRIGMISGPIATTTGAGRLEGYYAALRDASIDVDPDLVQLTTFKKESGAQAARALLSLKNPPTAIFAANNALGEATIFAIRDRQLRIPEDISIIQFDDVPWASLMRPSLSTVAQPTFDLGFIGMERLARRLKKPGESLDRLETMLLPQLIIRESCAPLGKS